MWVSGSGSVFWIRNRVQEAPEYGSYTIRIHIIVRKCWRVLYGFFQMPNTVLCLAGLTKCFLLVTGWPPAEGPACAELLLGVPGLHLQVLWGDPRGSAPQGHPPRPQDQLDVPPRDEAQGAARSDRLRQVLPRPGQGPQVHSDHRGLASRLLVEEELTQDPQEALNWVSFKINRGNRKKLYKQKIEYRKKNLKEKSKEQKVFIFYFLKNLFLFKMFLS